jgi:F0F1-type ATP synthase epsilon subunit
VLFNVNPIVTPIVPVHVLTESEERVRKLEIWKAENAIAKAKKRKNKKNLFDTNFNTFFNY